MKKSKHGMKNWIEGLSWMDKKLCILTGVGPETGTGAEIARYFSEKGYHVAMIARTGVYQGALV